MKGRTKLFLIASACGAGMLGALSTGFALANGWTFSGAAQADTDIPCRVSAWIDTKPKSIAPLGLQIYTTSQSPYNIAMAFTILQPTSSICKIFITNASITYDTGDTKPILNADWQACYPFNRIKYSNWSSNGIVYFQKWQARAVFTNCVDRNEPLTLSCQGWLLDKTANEMPFQVRWKFHPHKTATIVRGWHFQRPFDPP